MKSLKIFIFLSLCFNSVFAFANVADHFNVTFSKEDVISGEAVDLTIEAVDENGVVVKDYTGNIVGFSETDNEVQLPDELANDDGYTFKLSDEGVVTFENAVKFISVGKQELGIYDTDASQSVIGLGKINIIEKSTYSENIDIEILSPENGLTIGTNTISVSGETQKNHQVKIVLNNSDEFFTTTNSQGIFEKEIDSLEDGENLIQAYILDSDENEIGESNQVLIKIDLAQPQFKKITLSPLSEEGEVEEGKNILVNVYATPNLGEVSIIVDDSVIKLAESDDGVYVGNFNAPSEKGEYSVDLIMKGNLGNSAEEKNIANIKVKKVELSAGPELEDETPETNTGTVSVTETVNTTNTDELDISGLKLVKLKNKSILTWDELEEADGYNVYKKINDSEIILVETVKVPIFEMEITGEEVKYQLFAVKAYVETGSGTYEGNLSHATEIQTGPEIIILMILSLLLGLGFFMIKKRA